MAVIHKGRIISAEQRAKISATLTGKKHAPDRILAKSLRQKGRPISPASLAALIGRPCSAETRAKISAANTGRKRTMEQITRIKDGIVKAGRRLKESVKPPSGIVKEK